MHLDPKPWFCQYCSDRFARQNLLSGHRQVLRPRKQYDQKDESYEHTMATEA